ncbi:hypothetical protein DH2020_014143 [Rehmannia glutinosa]|uniref:Mannosyltransferase n=1 Tax=Rehmannia glutinosa TaxID=99300 RepID=A0ABR0WVI0_REHGL
MKQRRNPVIVSSADDDSDKKFTSVNPQIKNSPPGLYRIFIFCLITRMMNSLLVQTYFNPDEHWQAPEVAHRIAFGYGHLTWEWKKGIRSYLHPVLFAALYKVLAFLRLDIPWFMLTNWFMFFCITQTLSNSLETVLTLVSLYYWLCLRASSSAVPSDSRKCALAVAAVACAIRPTSAITWIYIGFLELFMARDKLKFVLLEVVRLAGVIMSKQWKLSGLIIWVLGIYSLLGHKEFRFVLPVLPIALMFSGYSLANVRRCEPSKRKVKESSSSCIKGFPSCKWQSCSCLEAEDVMNYLSNEARENKVKSILFLTPCHATPYYSTLHQNIPMRFLDCTPSEEKGILDESDRFLNDPFRFVTRLASNWTLPSHIVLFDSQEKLLKEFLASLHFYEIKRFFHAHFKVDRELQASVVVYAFHD